MRNTDLISMGFDYLWLGILAAGVFGSGFIIWYLCYFKRKCKDKKLNKGKVFLWCVFVIYMVVVFGATMLSRGNFYGNTKIYPIFYSYRDAWNDFSITEWRNIILNICMFVPLGVFLPILLKRMNSFWKVSLGGFFVTLFIETSQLFLKRGVFEIDDLIGNTVGTMIGYGMYYLIFCLIRKKNNEDMPQMKVVLGYQVPLIMVVGVFVTIFLVYQMKELGNMPSAMLMKQKNIEVDSNVKFKDVTENVMVYKASVMTTDETQKMVQNLFNQLGCEIDETRTDIYENTAVYYSCGKTDMDNRYSVWVEYDGGVFTFRDFDKQYDEEKTVDVKTNAAENEIRTGLEQLGIFVPIEAVFTNKEDGCYIFIADKLVVGDRMYDGYIECEYYEDGQFGMIMYQMLVLDNYKTMKIISESEAYEKIEKGEFNYWRVNDEMMEIDISGVKIGYEMDTKGFYQPVYVFDAKVNEFTMQISIPAIQ